MSQSDTRPGLTRRDFLRRGAAAAAGAAAFPLIVPGRALGLGGAVSANSRITVGFIGMGKMARGHLGSFLADPECQVLSLCDVERGRLESQAARVNAHYAAASGQGGYSACDVYGDFRALCARPDIDAVVIATPNHWHALNAVEALKNGKDVYLEKPLARTVNEGKALVRAARRYGRILQTGSQQRSDTAFRQACELVRNGRIGGVREVYVNVGGPPQEDNLPPEPVPEGLDWEMWLGPCMWRPYSSVLAPPESFDGWPEWRYYRPFAGGAMTDWGAHHYDIAQWGLGMDGSGPVEVIPPNPDNPEVTRITHVYANGVRMFHGGAGTGAGVEFVGTEGRVRVNRSQFLETEPGRLKHEIIGPNETRLYSSPDHRRNFLEAVRTRREPICPVEVGHRSATVCHLANIAHWLRRPLKWDPVLEEFPDDPEANRLLGRPMRAPWQLI
ncbi:MAG: Gfo/Idh/MocA family oxidoreductase [Candidatus Hydrogenedens sp.]|nr:Gfo/Idh/MocA family oxidoreductase [Candidatus Hydrogenedens sp.]